MNWHDEYLSQVDDKLISLTPKDIGGVGRMLEARGKRLRPKLLITIAHYSGRKVDDTVITAAAAIELIHLASLVHDDIMDTGTLRWGVPTINALEGNDMALLAGDYLLAKGCALATSISIEAGVIMADTIASLCAGQAIELKDQYNTNRTVESLNMAIKGKTSSLFIAACKLGGLVSGLNNKQVDALANFAENFGLAYQYIDDTQDFTKQPDTNKAAKSDVAEGNYTLPMLLSLKGAHKNTLEKILEDSPINTSEVLKILKADESLAKTLKTAETFRGLALNNLTDLKIPKLEMAISEQLCTILLA